MAVACTLCGHPSNVHRRTGGCEAEWACICGWVQASDERYKGVAVPSNRKRAFLKRGCHYCGGFARTIDHVMPRSKGGSHDCDNLVAACFVCNELKGARTLEEFICYCVWLEVNGTEKQVTHISKVLDRYVTIVPVS